MNWIAPESGAGRWLPPAAATLAVLSLSLIPGSATPEGAGDLSRLIVLVPPSLQNLAHVPVWAVAGCLWTRAVAPSSVPRAVIAAITYGLVFGIADESLQQLTPGRYPSLTDVALDVIGAGLGGWLYTRPIPRWLQRQRPVDQRDQ